MNLVHKFHSQGVIPVINLEDLNLIEPLLNIYQEFGINCIEITFRNENTIKLLQKMFNSHSEFEYGVGTVRNKEQLLIAKENQVKFIVTPGFNPNLSQKIIDFGFKYYFPGIDSTFGIEQAQLLNLSILKFFPAVVSGGAAFLKALLGPYPDLSFIPTGGIGLHNMVDFLELENVIAVGGTFIAPKNLIKNKKWNEIRDICEKTVNIVKKIRSQIT